MRISIPETKGCKGKLFSCDTEPDIYQGRSSETAINAHTSKASLYVSCTHYSFQFEETPGSHAQAGVSRMTLKSAMRNDPATDLYNLY